MAPTNELSGNFAGPVNTGVNQGWMDSHARIEVTGQEDTPAALLDLLARLRAEVANVSGADVTRDAALTLLDQLADGVDPQRRDDPEPGRLSGLFRGLSALVRPLSVGADLLTQIGRLLAALHGGA